MVRVAPAGTVPRAQGNADTQLPVVDRNVSPGGVASATFTLAAFEGPLLMTVMVNATVCPGVIDAGPVWVTCRSAEPPATGVETVPVLFPATGSAVAALAVVALTIGFAPA